MDSFIFNGNDPNSQDLHKQRIVRALMNPPQDIGSGLSRMGEAFAYRQQQDNPFPQAPGNSPFTGFGRLMGMFGKPGLY